MAAPATISRGTSAPAFFRALERGRRYFSAGRMNRPVGRRGGHLHEHTAASRIKSKARPNTPNSRANRSLGSSSFRARTPGSSSGYGASGSFSGRPATDHRPAYRSRTERPDSAPRRRRSPAKRRAAAAAPGQAGGGAGTAARGGTLDQALFTMAGTLSRLDGVLRDIGMARTPLAAATAGGDDRLAADAGRRGAAAEDGPGETWRASASSSAAGEEPLVAAVERKQSSVLDVLGVQLSGGATEHALVLIEEERWRCRQLFMQVDNDGTGTAGRTELLKLIARYQHQISELPRENAGPTADRFLALITRLHALVMQGMGVASNVPNPIIRFEEYAVHIRQLHALSTPASSGHGLRSLAGSAGHGRLGAPLGTALLLGTAHPAATGPGSPPGQAASGPVPPLMAGLGSPTEGTSVAARQALLGAGSGSLVGSGAAPAAVASTAEPVATAASAELFDTGALRQVFSQYCESTGRIGNTDWMSAAKFARLVRDAGIISEGGSLKARGRVVSAGLRKADVDLIFTKTLRLAKLGRLSGVPNGGGGGSGGGGSGDGQISGVTIGFGAFVAALRSAAPVPPPLLPLLSPPSHTPWAPFPEVDGLRGQSDGGEPFFQRLGQRWCGGQWCGTPGGAPPAEGRGAVGAAATGPRVRVAARPETAPA